MTIWESREGILILRAGEPACSSTIIDQSNCVFRCSYFISHVPECNMQTSSASVILAAPPHSPPLNLQLRSRYHVLRHAVMYTTWFLNKLRLWMLTCRLDFPVAININKDQAPYPWSFWECIDLKIKYLKRDLYWYRAFALISKWLTQQTQKPLLLSYSVPEKNLIKFF
jgi:hypothetical protein